MWRSATSATISVPTVDGFGSRDTAGGGGVTVWPQTGGHTPVAAGSIPITAGRGSPTSPGAGRRITTAAGRGTSSMMGGYGFPDGVGLQPGSIGERVTATSAGDQ